MKTNMTMFLPLALAMALGQVGCDTADRTAGGSRPRPVSETGHEPEENMKISLKFQDKTVTATLIDNETTRDFVSLLPLTLTMNDLFGREKFAHLPRAISEGGKRMKTYEVGDVIYWSPVLTWPSSTATTARGSPTLASSSWGRSMPGLTL